jgi:hypothetical protein
MISNTLKKVYITLILIVSLLCNISATNKHATLLEAYDLYAPMKHRTLLQWDEYIKKTPALSNQMGYYFNHLASAEDNYMIYPFWMGREYKEIPADTKLGTIKRLGYLGYILNGKTGESVTTYSWATENVVDAEIFKKIPIDLILFCRSKAHTELFLSSDSLQTICIKDFYSKIERKKKKYRKADGVNIYFPEFNIKQTNQLLHFVNALSEYGQNVTGYGKGMFAINVTFPFKLKKHRVKLSLISEAVDEVYYADYNSFGIEIEQKEPAKPPKPIEPSLIETIPFLKAYDRYIPYGYRNSKEWSTIRNKFSQHYNEIYTYKYQARSKRKYNYMVYPFWMGASYKNVFTGKISNIERFGYMGYIVNPYNGNADLSNSWDNTNILDSKHMKHIPADLMVICRGEKATDMFLESDSSQLRCIENMFEMMNRDSKRKESGRKQRLRNPNGINIYFPDYSFKKKRAFVQFVKSIVLVNRSIKDSTKSKGYNICVTFPEQAKTETPFLSSVLQYADSVYFTDYSQFGFNMSNTGIFCKATDTTLIFRRIYNQFLMARFKLKYNPAKEGDSSIAAIIKRGNPSNDWEYYMFAIVIILIIFLISPVAYYRVCTFQTIVKNYSVGVMLLLFMAILEIIILTMFMIENMSGEQILINIDNSSSLYLLLLPIALAAIYPLVKISKRQVQKP